MLQIYTKGAYISEQAKTQYRKMNAKLFTILKMYLDCRRIAVKTLN